MYRLVSLLFCCSSLFSGEILFSYLDKVQYEQNNLYIRNFPVNIDKQEIDSGMSISIGYPLNTSTSIMSIFAGSSFSKWDLSKDVTYAYATYFSLRLTPISLVVFSPYLEFSAAGPTYLSKNTLDDISFFDSKIVYQNYVAVGVKVAGFLVDFRLLNYSKDLPSAFSKESITLPFVLSCGCTF